MLANFEKLAATRLLMYDLTINTQKLKKLKKNFNVPLWDGMHSFNINRGDMMNNLFFRIRRMMKETPVLADIFLAQHQKTQVHQNQCRCYLIL